MAKQSPTFEQGKNGYWLVRTYPKDDGTCCCTTMLKGKREAQQLFKMLKEEWSRGQPNPQNT